MDDKLKRQAYHYDLSVLEDQNKPLITYEEWSAKQNNAWIYESPDKGKTVYRRKFWETERERIK